MWKRGGRSSALDRAQVLLTAKKSGGQGPPHEPLTQLSVGGSAKLRSAPRHTQPSLSDLSDLSSVSSVTEPPPRMVGSADVGNHGGGKVDPGKDAGPPSSVGGRSRFLKKPPAPVDSNQSPVSRIQSQQQLEPKYVSSSQRSPQTAALRRVAEIESRVRSRTQAQDQSRRGMKLAPASDVSPPAAPLFSEAPVEFSTGSSGDQNPKGNRFLKKDVSGAAGAAAPGPAGAGCRSNGAAAPPGGARWETMRAMSGVSLESDEEDMKRLLGVSEDSSDHSPPRPPGRTSSIQKLDQVSSSASQRPPSTPPPPAAAPLSPSLPSSAASPHPPRSPPRRDSPFRFVGRAQARFGPSSTSPSPPASPLARLSSSRRRAQSPQRSRSSPSALSEVVSLEELFPVGPGSPEPNSTVSSVSEDFKINVMTLDDLMPATIRVTPEVAGKKGEPKHALSVARTVDGDQRLEEEEEYPSDFEGDSMSVANHSSSQVSEHLLGDGGEGAKEASETTEKRSNTSVGTVEGYSSASSDLSRSRASPLSDGSQTSFSGRGDVRSESSLPHRARRPRGRSRLHAPPRRALKEAAVQTQPDPLAHTWLADAAAVDRPPMDPTPVLTHTLSTETVEALSSFNPALFALHEMFKQQLASTKTLVQSRRLLHTRLLQSLEPPNYRYTTLKDTEQLIQRNRSPKQTLEEALEKVLQEMRDCQCT